MPSTYTTIGGFPLMVAKALDSYGIDGNAVLARCNIDPQLLSDPDFRVPIDQLGKLLEVSIAETGDPAFGLKAGTFVCPTTFHALSMSMWLSSSLKDAFDRAVSYGQLLSDAGTSGVEVGEDEYCYWTELASPEQDFVHTIQVAAMDALYSAVVTLCRTLCNDSFAPKRVSFMRDEPEDIKPYQDFFRCPLEFSHPRIALCFDKATFDKPLPTGHPELLKHSDHVIIESMNRFDKQDIVGRLRAKLLERLPSGKPTQKDIAFSMNTSLRSLQRKLSEQGLTYEQVLEDVRRDLAQKYMAQPHLSIGEISYLLGFGSQTNFARAFKSWMGVTPREYRAKQGL
ncbi:AraC family transcriptional regulator [Maricurvus nonylphenolicus]|uniref:AraC family transcriptional regulator n=1 Tax=Maricurvus nonylphenolicus TaxID=1008307 RepID=UPI0036F1D10C